VEVVARQQLIVSVPISPFVSRGVAMGVQWLCLVDDCYEISTHLLEQHPVGESLFGRFCSKHVLESVKAATYLNPIRISLIDDQSRFLIFPRVHFKGAFGMSKVQISSEDLRRTNVLLKEIKNWRGVGDSASPGSRGACAFVVSRGIQLADGRETDEAITMSGLLDPAVLDLKLGQVDGDLDHGLGLIVGRHLAAMSADAVAFLEGLLPVAIVDDQPVSNAPQPAPGNMFEEATSAASAL
jgi:hypothetical protein